MNVTHATRETGVLDLLRDLGIDWSGARLTLVDLRDEWRRNIRLRESDLAEGLREMFNADLLRFIDGDPPAVEVTEKGAALLEHRLKSESLIEVIQARVTLTRARRRPVSAGPDLSHPARRTTDHETHAVN